MANSMKNTPELTQEEVVPFLIKPLETKSLILRQGPMIIDSQGDPLRIPKLDDRGDDPTWKAENEKIDEAEAEFDEVTLLPTNLKSIKTITRFSNELARHSVLKIGTVLQANVVHKVANTWDTAALLGAGTVDGNGNRPVIGLINQPDIQTASWPNAASATGAGSLVDATVGAYSKLLNAEIETFDKVVWFMSLLKFEELLKVKDSEGRGFLVPDINNPAQYRLQGIRVVPTSKLPEGTQLLVDFTYVVVGRDLSPSVKILDQLYGDYDQMGIRCVARMDIGLLHPEAVVKITDGA